MRESSVWDIAMISYDYVRLHKMLHSNNGTVGHLNCIGRRVRCGKGLSHAQSCRRIRLGNSKGLSKVCYSSPACGVMDLCWDSISP